MSDDTFGFKIFDRDNRDYYRGNIVGHASMIAGGAAAAGAGKDIFAGGGVLALSGGGALPGALTMAGGAAITYVGGRAIALGASNLAKAQENYRYSSSEGTGESGSTIKGLGAKSEKYLAKRGWTSDTAQDVVGKPYTTREAVNKATGNKATAYYNKAGDYVVVDDVSGELVQTSKFGDTGWIPDSTINNPYKP